MTREELNQLRILRTEIERDIRKLRAMEKKERTAAQYGQSLLRSLKRSDAAEEVEGEKAALIHSITAKQYKYLAMRAELENKICSVPDHYIRCAMSMMYVDGLTSHEAAANIQGSCTGGGLIRLLCRYFERRQKSYDNTGAECTSVHYGEY